MVRDLDPYTPRTVEEWAIRRQRALDLCDLHISVLRGIARLHGIDPDAAMARAQREVSG